MNYAVPTKSNTAHGPWWALLNSELAKLGLGEAAFGVAHDLYETGHCPRTAAAEIEATQ